MSSTQESSQNNDFYRFYESYDDTFLVQFIGLIISDLKVENFELNKRKWTFEIMQIDNNAMNVEFVSTCPADELRLHKLYKSIGSIIFCNNAYVRMEDKTIVIINDPELWLFAMCPTVAQIRRFLKDSGKL